MAAIADPAHARRTLDVCSQRVIEMMKDPGTGPFWMFPAVCVAYTGRDKLTPEARAAIRDAWRTTRQLRGDTENHWVMYYASLYLMAELYPNEPAETGIPANPPRRTSPRRAATCCTGWTTHDLGRAGGVQPHPLHRRVCHPHAVSRHWAKDPAMKSARSHDARLALRRTRRQHAQRRAARPNSRTDEGSVIERWNALASYFSWLLFGNTPPTGGYGGWGLYFAPARQKLHGARGHLPHRHRPRRRLTCSATARAPAATGATATCSRPPVYKTNYLRRDYAVGSIQGIMNDAIQATLGRHLGRGRPARESTTRCSRCTRIPRCARCSRNSSPIPSHDHGVTFEGKPSYDSPDKVLGASPYEKVFQDLDTVIALYDIAPGCASRTSTAFSPRTSSTSPRTSPAGSSRRVATPTSPTARSPLPLDPLPPLQRRLGQGKARTSAAGCSSART
jgi:hypothetical protein